MGAKMSKQQFSIIVLMLVALVASILYATYSANMRAADRLRFQEKEASDRAFRENMRDLNRPLGE